MSGINEKPRMFCASGVNRSTQNLQNHGDNKPSAKGITFVNPNYKNYGKPTTFRNYRQKNAVSTCNNKNRAQTKRFTFLWPPRRRFYYEKQLSSVLWFLTHTLFWLDALHIFPSGAGIPLSLIPWYYEPPAPEPRTKFYVYYRN